MGSGKVAALQASISGLHGAYRANCVKFPSAIASSRTVRTAIGLRFQLSLLRPTEMEEAAIRESPPPAQSAEPESRARAEAARAARTATGRNSQAWAQSE